MVIILSNRIKDGETGIKYVEFSTDYFPKDILIKLIKENDEFNKLLMSGKYFYYEGRLWLCHKDVVCIEDGQIIISETALSNKKDYCLSRTYKVPIIPRYQNRNNSKIITRSMFPERMKPYLTPLTPPLHSRHRYRTIVPQSHSGEKVKPNKVFKKKSDNQRETIYVELKETVDIVLMSTICNAIREPDYEQNSYRKIYKNTVVFTKGKNNNKDIGGNGRNGNNNNNNNNNNNKDYLFNLIHSTSFAELFSFYMEWRKLTVENLSNKTGIPEKTISRMRTNEKYKPSLAYIALCCIAMELMSWDCDRLVELAGYYLRIENDEERCYKGCLSGGLASSGDFDLCDNLFVTNGFKPLTSIVSLNRNRNQIN